MIKIKKMEIFEWCYLQVGYRLLCLGTSSFNGNTDDFIKGSEQNVTQEKTGRNVLKQLRSENKKLKKELNRKEKALAETVALLVLRKKLDALWEENEDA
ncbi:hypothetical protein [Bathymodiolus japonicus methanotrophic gill symbiont]|uniref:hypothetical protein n=1 Tax=Bathymodiolus japonicus methanotrophic gill symbiont TaxID=113269 RepID=UPI001C8D7E32|nr:hypothetical protein [Bathymodiolus japonicus methanotrophic gill symbiont]